MSSDISSGCSSKDAAFPDEVQCPHCNAYVEMWSDDTEVQCASCGKPVANANAVPQ